MLGRAVFLLLAPLLAGCIAPGLSPWHGVPGPSEWTWTLEDSMLPDFSGDGPSYPVLAIHHHAGGSERDRREWERDPPVCLADTGVPLASFPADDAIECIGPIADTATGRLFVPRETFDA